MNNGINFEELDWAIEAMISGPAQPASSRKSQLSELLQVASDLRQLPRPDFKLQLKRELEWLAAARPLSPARPVSAIGQPDILPSLFAGDGGTFPVRQINFAVSLAVHAAAMVLVLVLGAMTIREAKKLGDSPHVISLAEYVPPVGSRQPRGGGSGGDADHLNASHGTPPRPASEQLTPPVVVIRNSDPKLPAEPTIIAPNLHLPQSNQMGDPLSTLMNPSGGPGVRGGIGANSGGGAGDGEGPGYGHGSGGNFGGHVYRVGNGISTPRVIYDPEPEYSPEARAAKYQGTVTLWAIIGPDGRPRGLRVERSLGMGLDEKALEAVNTWRFDPATKDGRPVPVMIEIEVSFHLY
jgi:protein TonB